MSARTEPRRSRDELPARRQRRAALRLLVGVSAVVLLLAAALVLLHNTTSPPQGASTPGGLTDRSRPGMAPAGGGVSEAQWRVLRAPMLRLPPAAARPSALLAERGGQPIVLPTPVGTVQAMPRFPRTAAGAVATLRAVTESGMDGGDPRLYARAYRAASAPGAPHPQQTVLGHALRVLRARLGPAADSGAVLVRFTVTDALIKGSTDAGSWVVACVLGEVTLDSGARRSSAGLGDCQALRWLGGRWQISPGPLPAPAPCAWPGSADAVHAGYREVRDQ